METFVKEGDEIGAEVMSISQKCISVVLDTGENATLYWHGLKGRSPEDRVKRGCELKEESELRVCVTSITEGRRLERRIVVRECYETSVLGQRPSRFGHRSHGL